MSALLRDLYNFVSECVSTYRSPIYSTEGYYHKTYGPFPSVYYYHYYGDLDPVKVNLNFGDKFRDLGSGYAHCYMSVYYEGYKINVSGNTNKFRVIDPARRTAMDSYGNIYICGQRC